MMPLILPLILLFRVTFFYDTGHTMSSGRMPFTGAAACSADFPINTQISLASNGRWLDLVCLDRGHIDERHWIDVYAATEADGADIARRFSPYAYGHIVRLASKSQPR